MKKKLIILVTLFVFTLGLVGCSDNSKQQLTVEDFSDNPASSYSMFIEIERTMDYIIVYHKNTRVMYAVSIGSYNRGNFTVLLEADGTPMLYEK